MYPSDPLLRIAVIVPALDEAEAIGRVLDELPNYVDRVIVADNGSTDATAEIARAHGAQVVMERRRGYGSACLAALATLVDDPPDVIVFIDGDHSDDARQMDRLLQPIARGEADLVIGSRVLGRREPGALSPQQRWGNALACLLMKILWRGRFTDLGPFRAVTYAALARLDMNDPDWGWTVEMQVRALQRGLRCAEVPVDYRKRIGVSKISGTVRGVLAAGRAILGTIAREAMRSLVGPTQPFGTTSDAAGDDCTSIPTVRPRPVKRISVIIPALNEEEHIGDALKSIAQDASHIDVETIVVDGGSIDATVDVARGYQATIVQCASGPGRARQMNAGAAVATGDVLLFLHADATLPAEWCAHVRRALAHHGVVAGAFTLKLDEIGIAMRIIERLVAWRSRVMRMPWGDQAIFMRADVFRAMGGFPAQPIMEDYELVRRLRSIGEIAMVESCVTASARQWRRQGVLRATVRNQLTVIGYRLGLSLKRLAAWRNST